MNKIPFLLFPIIIGTAISCQVFGQPPAGDGSQYPLLSLEQKCGYKLSKQLVQSVTAVETKAMNNYYYFNIFVKIKLSNKSVAAEVIFGCEFPADNNASISTLSPKEMIIDEDSSGRYGRNVKWERAFNAMNWKGRVAYVNSQFGDGIETNLPDYLLICPLSFNSLCTSFEVIDDTRLNAKEVNAVIRLLETIAYVPTGVD
ncbi:MAG: hypothetical protein LBQ81_03375 [Zoogloeaceae bacterium]|nr:hypothetical protein [Zoogloeaceae bacterium]